MQGSAGASSAMIPAPSSAFPGSGPPHKKSSAGSASGALIGYNPLGGNGKAGKKFDYK